MTEVWSFPTRILYGEGASKQVADELTALEGTKALLVTDPGVLDAGLVESLGSVLRAAKVEFQVFSSISSNPKEAEVLQGVEMYRAMDADCIVALGGGSAIDVGKLVGLIATHHGSLGEFEESQGGAQRIQKILPPLVAVPTTAGTGSEVGRSGVVTLLSTGQKSVVFSPHLIPSVAVLDPVLTVSLPAEVTASTGFDALTHAIEAYCAVGNHPMADSIARQAIELVTRYLDTAVHEPDNLQARGNMLQASMMGAVAFQKGLGACHALAHPLSSELGMHHGLANALCLPAVLDYNRSAVPERVARVARILGVKGDEVETLAFECGGAVRALRDRVGLPKGLGDAGIAEDTLPKLAALATQDPVHQTNPRPCTEDDFLSLYRASM